MAFDELRVYASGDVPEKEWLCVRADGEGDVAASHVVWRTDQRVTYLPSALVHEGCLFFVTDGGTVFCLDAASGEEMSKHRLGGSFIASPVLAGDNIFATADNGTTFVFGAERKYNEPAMIWAKPVTRRPHSAAIGSFCERQSISTASGTLGETNASRS